MDGLIIRPEWLAQIYERTLPFTECKTWETRSRKTTKRGRIYLLSSGGYVTGEATIVDCIEITSEKQWLDNVNKHQVAYVNGEYAPDMTYLMVRSITKRIYAWVLEDVTAYEKKIKYNHPKGAVIWVNSVEDKIAR